MFLSEITRSEHGKGEAWLNTSQFVKLKLDEIVVDK
jgi:hypothetical protein